jgi:hypothetical protein
VMTTHRVAVAVVVVVRGWETTTTADMMGERGVWGGACT